MHADRASRWKGAPWGRIAGLALFALLPKCPLCVLAVLGLAGAVPTSGALARIVSAPWTAAIGGLLLVGVVAAVARRRGIRAAILVLVAAAALWTAKLLLGNHPLVLAGIVGLTVAVGLFPRRSAPRSPDAAPSCGCAGVTVNGSCGAPSSAGARTAMSGSDAPPRTPVSGP